MLAALRCTVSCTIASRREASSPASQQNVIMPCTQTWPEPSSPATIPTPRVTSAAPSGSHGSGACIRLAAIRASPEPPIVMH